MVGVAKLLKTEMKTQLFVLLLMIIEMFSRRFKRSTFNLFPATHNTELQFLILHQ